MSGDNNRRSTCFGYINQMIPNSNHNNQNFDLKKEIEIQTFLEAMDQHPQLVHRGVINVVVEVKHKLRKYDVVDHHYIRQKINLIESMHIVIAKTLIDKFFLNLKVNQEMREEIFLGIKYLFVPYCVDDQNNEAFQRLKNLYKVQFLVA